MTSTLTKDQSTALAEQSDRLLHLVDPMTNETYVLVPEAEYARLRESAIDPRDAYRAVEQAFADNWNDAKLDDYDRYEELRK